VPPAPPAQILSILAQLTPNHPHGASRMLAAPLALHRKGGAMARIDCMHPEKPFVLAQRTEFPTATQERSP